MIDVLLVFERIAIWMMWAGVALAAGMIGVVIVERLVWTWDTAYRHALERRYLPVIRRALAGDQAARHELTTSPRRRRLALAQLLIVPFIDDRNPDRIAAARVLVRSMFLVPLANRYLHSRWWWRRALVLRAFGLLQMTDRTAAVVAALDDENADVRGAALDALADLRDPASLRAIVVRLLDSSLHCGRRAALVTAFGSQCEPLVLELAQVDAENRVAYARVLSLCGTGLSRSMLVSWATDPRIEVRLAALAALAHVGLDELGVSVALGALESRDVAVRAMAARALRGCPGAGEAVSHLVHHLDDDWSVAVQAARSLQSIPVDGFDALRAWAGRSDLAGLLARQMLWESHAS